jgi:hypothetical protein
MAESIDIAEVIKSIQDEVTTIVRGEIALATDELKGEAAKAGIIAGLFGGAGYLALSALAVLFSAFGFAWAIGFQAWFRLDVLTALFLGFLVMGVLMLLIAGVMGYLGTRAPQPGPPSKTIESAKDQVEFVKSTITEANAKVAGKALPPVESAAEKPALD